MVFRLSLLADNSVHHSLKNVFLRQDTVHVLNQLVSLINFIVLKVVNHQVETCFGNHIQQGRQNLQSVFTTTEYDQIVSQQIIVCEDVAHSR